MGMMEEAPEDHIAPKCMAQPHFQQPSTFVLSNGGNVTMKNMLFHDFSWRNFSAQLNIKIDNVHVMSDKTIILLQCQMDKVEI